MPTHPPFLPTRWTLYRYPGIIFVAPKRVEFPDHAQDRMSLRGITRAEVRWLIARGIRTRARSLPGRDWRWSSRGFLGHREAQVVFVESRDRIEIVTVRWTDERNQASE